VKVGDKLRNLGTVIDATASVPIRGVMRPRFTRCVAAVPSATSRRWPHEPRVRRDTCGIARRARSRWKSMRWARFWDRPSGRCLRVRPDWRLPYPFPTERTFYSCDPAVRLSVRRAVLGCGASCLGHGSLSAARPEVDHVGGWPGGSCSRPRAPSAGGYQSRGRRAVRDLRCIARLRAAAFLLDLSNDWVADAGVPRPGWRLWRRRPPHRGVGSRESRVSSTCRPAPAAEVENGISVRATHADGDDMGTFSGGVNPECAPSGAPHVHRRHPWHA
jgi:hypothetical protein